MPERIVTDDEPKDKAFDAREQTGVSTDSLTAPTTVQRVGHTPGPWQVVGPVGYIYTVGDPYRHGEMHVAQVRGWGHLTGTGGGCAFPDDKAVAIQNANARLIAAAPDLLACLRRMCGMYGAYSRRLAPLLAEDEGIVWTFERANSLACEAIAKAEGR